MSAPPTVGEIWRPLNDSDKAVVVVRCSDATIDYAWLDGESDCDGSAPAAQWHSRFAIVLEQSDHAHATPVRRRHLIDDCAAWLRGKSVLELGAHTGGLTESILGYAASVTALENNPRCVAHLRGKFGDRVEVVEGDMHHELWRIEPHRFDVVVCAGVLYHSAHPFLLLEAMAHLAPQRILIDTLNHGVDELRVVVPHMINSCNYRYNQRPDCGFSLVLGDRLIEQAMATLGYAQRVPVDKRSATIAPKLDSAYFREWKNSYAAWFHRPGFAPADAQAESLLE
ncbi:class I SAM-dependent methyltransferase [Lysobacter sp. Root690]|uniref:class I SAM-dependent methyltransferase n=1 Tax=Lysobacter sp. Root690 TaxID=1736588 RepID=UPI000B25AE82|nr:class I SAM-dependent methyltransferase [Lysobacter sp. Root690]